MLVNCSLTVVNKEGNNWAIRGIDSWELLFKCWDFEVFGGNANGLYEIHR